MCSFCEIFIRFESWFRAKNFFFPKLITKYKKRVEDFPSPRRFGNVRVKARNRTYLNSRCYFIFNCHVNFGMIAGTNTKSPGQTPPARNPLGGNGPGVGRTMKDYEDQLATLQKENFQLKLRIYFLEEKMHTSSGNEDAVKMNIQLKVSVCIGKNWWILRLDCFSGRNRVVEN